MDDCKPSGYTLSEVLNQYFMVNFNDKRHYYMNHLYITKLVFRELFWNTIFALARTDLPIEQDENGYFIRKPRTMARLSSVQVHDDCGYHELLISGSVPLESVKAPAAGNCQCGGAELCNIVKSTVSTRVENFNGTDYTLKTWYDTLGTGEVYQVTENVVYDSGTGKVIIEPSRVLSCNLDVSECGCPKPTVENKQIIVEACGCLPIFSNCPLPTLKNDYGYFNYDVQGTKIYLKAGKDCKPLPGRALLVWQTNFQDSASVSEDCIVPEYALTTMFTGIMCFSVRWRRGGDLKPGERAVNIAEWEGAKMDLAIFMNPFDPVMFRKIQSILPKWG